MYNVGDIMVRHGRGWNMVYKIIEKLSHPSGTLYTLQSVKLKHDYIEEVPEGYLTTNFNKRIK